MPISKRIGFFCLFFTLLSVGGGALAAGADANAGRKAAAEAEEYYMGPGDVVKITVFNQQDLSGEYTISASGQLSLPLIGTVDAKNLTVKQLEQAIIDRLKPDYLLNPQISIQVLNYRPFYILGEVKEPKSYPYVAGMTYRNAVAIAGGFTYRAKQDHVLVVRMNDAEKKELELNIDEKVMPGDIIRIEERFF